MKKTAIHQFLIFALTVFLLVRLPDAVWGFDPDKKNLHYATPNSAAEKLLRPEHLNNPLIYPSPDVLSRSEFYSKLPPRIKKERNEIFSRVLKQEKTQ